MRMAITLVLVTLFSGCATIENLFSSCEETQAKDAYNAANSSTFGHESFLLRDKGTIEGTMVDIRLEVDVNAESLRLKTLDEDLRLQHPYRYLSTEEGAWLQRDHNPSAGYSKLMDQLNEPLPEAPTPFSAYEISCATEGEVTLKATAKGQQHVLTLESQDPFRVLYEKTVDEETDTHLESTIHYQQPVFTLPLRTERWPATLSASHSTTYNGQDLQAQGTFSSETHWVPLGDLEIHVFNENGTLAESSRLNAGTWTMADGKKFIFEDRDDNEMTSQGDRYSMDLDWGWDMKFYDTWANEYTFEHQSAIKIW